jgi:hypothetical protein
MTVRRTNDADRWAKESAALDGSKNPLKIPYDVALKEAAGLAGFIRLHWEPTGDVPGLKRVKNRLPLSMADDLVSLVADVGKAQTELLLLVDPAVVKHGERARFVVDELESAIAFTLDDDIHEAADDQLAQLQEFHAQDGQRSSALAQALRDYGALATTLKARIVAADAEFDTKLLAEASTLAATLDAEAADPATGKSPAAKDATVKRNQRLALLMQKVALVRKVGGHVYRRHPEVLREMTSAYDRRRRAAARREKAKNAAPQDGATPPA